MTLLELGVAQMLESILAKEPVASHPLRVSCPLQTCVASLQALGIPATIAEEEP